MENTVTLLLADYDRLKRVEEKLNLLLEFDKNKDRFFKVHHTAWDVSTYEIKNSVDGDKVLFDQIKSLQEETIRLKTELDGFRKKRWSLWRWIKY